MATYEPIGRQDAIAILAESVLAELSVDERLSLLLDSRVYEDEPDFKLLPAELQERLKGCDDSSDAEERADGADSVFDPLLRRSIRSSYKGVLNSYLQARLSDLGHERTVTGVVEEMPPCPCCGYLCLPEDHAYAICRVCFWEDCGERRLDRISGPNHMSLRKARQNFETIGAVEERFLQNVLPDGPRRYARLADWPAGGSGTLGLLAQCQKDDPASK